MSDSFRYPPSPAVLQWLSAGQLANRLQRSVRLWVLLTRFYGREPNWTAELPRSFSYAQLRDRLFSASHPQPEDLTVEEVMDHCKDTACVCHRSTHEWVFASEHPPLEATWIAEMSHLTGLDATALKTELELYPFATVHRSIRDDLKLLVKLGWLQSPRRGAYQWVSVDQLPTLAKEGRSLPNVTQLSESQSWELLRVLEAVSFVQPNLEVVVQSLWEQITPTPVRSLSSATEPQQRIFIHLDYILPDDIQERVDTYQEDIEHLWRSGDDRVVQFEYWLARKEQKVTISTYPVCFHYVRRAKYLSAYGIDPNGNFGWHNYRLDRILSPRLKVLEWDDLQIPKRLKTARKKGQLPTPEEVDRQLKAAWGFDFYLKPALLILRFPPKFAQWYVDNTDRHPTFKPIAYRQLPTLIRQSVPDVEHDRVLEILKARSPRDAYYHAWIRVEDINVMMRLRDWRPNGEVIAPLSVRDRMAQEAAQELQHYV